MNERIIIYSIIDVWVLTTGLNTGVSKLIGQGIHRHTLLNEGASNPVVIGMSSWGTITEYTRSLLKSEMSKVLASIEYSIRISISL